MKEQIAAFDTRTGKFEALAMDRHLGGAPFWIIPVYDVVLAKCCSKTPSKLAAKPRPTPIRLTGHVPELLHDLASLVHLSIPYNRLTGTLPEHGLCGMTLVRSAQSVKPGCNPFNHQYHAVLPLDKMGQQQRAS
eukprot:2643724-Amphidinium_carterae.1